MNRHRWIQISAALAAVGGAAWLAKLAVIAATDGATTDTGAAAAFYLLGVALMVVGSTWVGSRLAARRGRVLLTVLVLLSPLVFFVSFAVLDAVGKAAVGDAGPAWLEDEIGIVLTGVAWLAAGVLARRAAAPTADTRGNRRAKHVMTAGVLVLLVAALGACGGDGDDDDSQSASAEYCEVARELDAAGEELPPELLDRYVEVAPSEVRDDADFAAQAIEDRGEAAFEDPRVGEAVDRIGVFETTECGIDHDDDEG